MAKAVAATVGPRSTSRQHRVRLGAIGLVTSGASIAVLVASVDVGASLRVLAGAEPAWLLATVLLVPGQILLRAFRWHLLLPHGPNGARPSVARVAPVLVVGYLGNLVLPARLGELVRTYLVARRENLEVSGVLGSVLLERVLDLASLAVIAVLAAVAAGAPDWIVNGLAAVSAGGLVVVFLLVGPGVRSAVRLVARLGVRLTGRLERPLVLLAGFAAGAAGDGRRIVAVAMVLSAATWLFVATTFWLVGQSLGLALHPEAALLITAVTVLGTAIPSAPAHIGTFQVAAVVAATSLGVPAAEALALGLLAHVITTVPMALVGVGALGWLSLSLREVAGQASAWRDPSLPAERRA